MTGAGMDMETLGRLPSPIRGGLPRFRAASRLFRLFLQVKNRRRQDGNLPARATSAKRDPAARSLARTYLVNADLSMNIAFLDLQDIEQRLLRQAGEV
jgi:hypothetical protein